MCSDSRHTFHSVQLHPLHRVNVESCECLNIPAQISMHSDGRYAFVEFATHDMATAALALDGQARARTRTYTHTRVSNGRIHVQAVMHDVREVVVGSRVRERSSQP
jgi:hypothetical protein